VENYFFTGASGLEVSGHPGAAACVAGIAHGLIQVFEVVFSVQAAGLFHDTHSFLHIH